MWCLWFVIFLSLMSLRVCVCACVFPFFLLCTVILQQKCRKIHLNRRIFDVNILNRFFLYLHSSKKKRPKFSSEQLYIKYTYIHDMVLIYVWCGVESRLNTFLACVTSWRTKLSNGCEHRIFGGVCQAELKHENEWENKGKEKEESEMLLGNFLNGNCINLIVIRSHFFFIMCKPKCLWCTLDAWLSKAWL